jgi:hypothetical protein
MLDERFQDRGFSNVNVPHGFQRIQGRFLLIVGRSHFEPLNDTINGKAWIEPWSLPGDHSQRSDWTKAIGQLACLKRFSPKERTK